jgi:hypothetical protein
VKERGGEERSSSRFTDAIALGNAEQLRILCRREKKKQAAV